MTRNSLMHLQTHINLRTKTAVGCAMSESVSEKQRPVSHT